jgi:hypothetical protein
MSTNRIKNHFRFGARFEHVAFSEQSRTDVEMTPEDVAKACEDFAARIRGYIARQAAQETERGR